MDMKRPPVSLYLITVTGVVLSIWLVIYGLQMRFFGTLLDPKGMLTILAAPVNYLRWVDLLPGEASIGALGWPLVVIGSSLLGSLTGLWLRQKWARGSLIIFSLASLITVHWLNIFSLLLLGIGLSGALRKWLAAE